MGSTRSARSIRRPRSSICTTGTTAARRDYVFGFGEPKAGWVPVAGDWNAAGHDGVGLVDPVAASFSLRESLSHGRRGRGVRIRDARRRLAAVGRRLGRDRAATAERRRRREKRLGGWRWLPGLTPVSPPRSGLVRCPAAGAFSAKIENCLTNRKESDNLRLDGSGKSRRHGAIRYSRSRKTPAWRRPVAATAFAAAPHPSSCLFSLHFHRSFRSQAGRSARRLL